MRVGMNPQKQHKKIELQEHHRVITVVFIPNLEGYYQDMFAVFKLSLESVLVTKNKFCAITVVNNGCCDLVVQYLNQLYLDGKIDSLVHHKQNIGKIDALVGAARGTRERLITTTDADILFVKGWQEHAEQVFHNFTGVGSVSPLPIRVGLTSGTMSTLQKIIFQKVSFGYETIRENFAPYNKFRASIGWDLEDSDDLPWPVVTVKGVKAIVGSAHQVLTIDRDIFFSDVPYAPSLTLVGNNSEHDYIDTPIDLSGKMRLSTYHNFAYHMGNKAEDWMYELQEHNKEGKVDLPIVALSNLISSLNQSRFKVNWFKIKKIAIKKIFKTLYT